MRIPEQVTERVKEAPAQALRAVFSGIGQVLLVADRIKSRAAELQRETPPDPGPRAESAACAQSAPHAAPAPAPREETRWRSLDETGNVRLLPQQEVTGGRPGASEPAPAAPEAAWQPADTAAEPAAPEPAAPEAARQPADIAAELTEAAPQPAADGAPEPAASAAEATSGGGPSVLDTSAEPPASAALPLSNYDDLTVASLRARLRNLDSAQVGVLLDYEKANAGRPAVLTMFERRIAKLESGQA